MSSAECKNSAGGYDAGSSGDELMGWICPLFKEAELVELIGRRICHSISARETDHMRTCHCGWQRLSYSGRDLVRQEYQLLEAHQPVSLETYPRPWNKFVWNVTKFVCVYHPKAFESRW